MPITYDLAQLRAFIHVVEEGSIGRAAERLCITQPALSRTIKRLENSVGDALFERHAVGMRLTSVGMALLPHAQLLNREEQLAREEIMAMRGLAAGTLRLGVTSSTSAVMLPALVAKFWKRWPDLKIEAIEGVREELSLALKNYKVDLILAAAAPDSDEVIAIKDCRWTEEVSVVAGQSHPLVQVREPLTLEQLRSYRWGFVPRATEPYERFVQIFADHALTPPDIAITTPSIALLKSMVCNGGLLSWMTKPMYVVERDAGRMFPLVVRGMTEIRSFTVFRRRNGMLPRPAAAFLDEVRAYVQRL